MKVIDKATHRRCARPYRGTITEARGRQIVVSTVPGDVLVLRPSGRRRAEEISIEAVYELAYWTRVKAERAARRRG